MKVTDFLLHGPHRRTIAPAMKTSALLALIAILPISACRKPPAEVVVSETRPSTTKDLAPKLFATSDQRFRDARPSPVRGETPAGWLAVPATQIRLLNYRFGESGLGEVWVSVSSGSVLDNVNRWLGQFSAAKLNNQSLGELRSVSIATESGVWVETEGDYEGGMGAPPRPGYALAGVVADFGGRILTVKMIGPKAEVATAKATLESFAKSLSLTQS
jgi:hypothetical protein